MIRINPDQLDFARRLSGIRREASRTDGPLNRRQCHDLSYAGGDRLCFRTSDLEIGMMSNLVVQGTDEPWSCRIAHDSFHWVQEFAEGGSYALDPHHRRCVRLEKNQFGFPLFKIPAETPFPVPTVPLDSLLWTTVEIRRLIRALEFVAPSGATCRSERLNSVAWLKSGELLGHFNGAFLQSAAERIPFEFNIDRHNAFRVMRWLKLMHRAVASTEVDIAMVEDGNVPCFVFATQNREHVLYVLGSKHSTPPRLSNQVARELPALSVIVDSRVLRSLAGFISCYRRPTLLFRIDTGDQHVPHVEAIARFLSIEGRDFSELIGTLSVETKPGQRALEAGAFEVSASELFRSIQRHKARTLTFSHLPQANVLELASNRRVSSKDETVLLRSFIRSRPAESDN